MSRPDDRDRPDIRRISSGTNGVRGGGRRAVDPHLPASWDRLIPPVAVLTGVEFRSLAVRAREDGALVIGLVGGSIASLAGLVAYFQVPYALGGSSTPGEAIVDGAFEFMSVSPLYHAVALVVVPFVCTAVAVVGARERGLSGRSTDLKIVGSIVLIPFTTVVVVFLLTAVGIGVTIGFGVTEAVWYERILVTVGVSMLGVLVGGIFLLFVASVVLVAEIVGAGSGYLLARRLSRR